MCQRGIFSGYITSFNVNYYMLEVPHNYFDYFAKQRPHKFLSKTMM